MTHLLRAAALVLAASAIAAQAQPAAPPPAFEVADIQISKSGKEPNADFLPGGKLILQSVTMKQMISAAWDLDRFPDNVTGGPEWLDADRYDIVAKAVPTATEKDLRLMLRTLLIERFKLETHMESKPLPVYALVVGRKGRLQESPAGEGQPDDCKIQTPQQRKDGQMIRSFICRRTSMDYLSRMLPRIASGYLDLPVVNLTELTGRYDFTLGWTPRRGGRAAGGADASGSGKLGEVPTASDAYGLTPFEALPSQLGLKLEQRKLPTDVLVIDKIQRQPVEN